MPRLRERLSKAMSDEDEHQPGDSAPASAHSEELTVFRQPYRAMWSMFAKAIGFHLHRAALRGGGYGMRAASGG